MRLVPVVTLSVTSIVSLSSFCGGARVWSRLVALDSRTEPRVTDVGQVEFTALPVPPEQPGGRGGGPHPFG
jgi:hypothetical protein